MVQLMMAINGEEEVVQEEEHLVKEEGEEKGVPGYHHHRPRRTRQPEPAEDEEWPERMSPEGGTTRRGLARGEGQLLFLLHGFLIDGISREGL